MKIRILPVILFFLFFSISLFAQHNENSLLWQIKGNGLTKPSYLFGTIHLTDKEVFDFPDSVIAKLLECDALALEVNLDSVSHYILSDPEAYNKSKKLKDLFKEKDLKKIKKSLSKEKKFKNKNIENVTVRDLYRYNLEKDRDNTDMSTFLDAYLYGVAKRSDKKIIGLEHIEDQLNIISGMSDDVQRSMAESMVDSVKQNVASKDSLVAFYERQDLDAIYKNMNEGTPEEFYKSLITVRNGNMARSIDSLIHLQSVFIAVGTAHLPGDGGLIDLLRQKGYTVTPLPSPRTSYYKKILPDAHLSWKTMRDTITGYQVQMPGDPTNMAVSGLDMKGVYDMGSGYMFLSTAIPGHAKSLDEEIFDRIKKQMSQLGTINKTKKLKYKNLEVEDLYINIAGNNHYILRVVNSIPNGYLLMIGLPNKDPAESYVSHFFNSFDVIAQAPVVTHEFVSDTGAFAVDIPARLTLKGTISEGTSFYRHYTGYDLGNNVNYSLSYIDYKPGTYFPDVDNVFNTFVTELSKALETEPLETIDDNIDGVPCIYLRYHTSAKAYATIEYYLRNNRVYYITADYTDTSKEAEIRKILSTARFLPFLQAHYEKYEDPGKKFTAMFPGKVIMKVDTLMLKDASNVSYGASDYFSGSSFMINDYEPTPYLYYKSDSIHFDALCKINFTENDTIAYKTSIQQQDQYIHQVKAVALNHEGTARYVRFVLSGNDSYTLSTTLPDSKTSDSLADYLFNSFKINKPTPTDLFKPKSARIIADLRSADSATHENALNGFKNYEFEAKDTTEMLKALLLPFADDSAGDKNSRYTIYEKIFDLMDSGTCFEFIKKNYSSFAAYPAIQLLALKNLTASHIPQAYDLLADHLLKNPPVPHDEGDADQVFSPLYYYADSSATRLFPRLLPLLEDSNYRIPTLLLISSLLRENIIVADQFKSSIPIIINEAIKELSTGFMLRGETYNSKYYPLLIYSHTILKYADENPSVVNYFTKLINDTSFKGSLEPAFLYLIKYYKPYKKESYEKFIADAANRISMYEELVKINRTDAYPGAYLDQKYFAESDLLNFLNYDDDFEGQLLLIKQKNIEYNGEHARIYTFKIKFSDTDDGTNTFFGMAGPYPDEKKKVFTSGALTGTYYTHYNDMSLEEHIKAYMERKENDLKEGQ